MNNTLQDTTFHFPGQKDFYRGKVRDVYFIGDDLLVMVASDRISAFDHVLPRGIPYKGQVLNQTAACFLERTKEVVPNWMIASPDPNVTIGRIGDPYPVEMVVRGYLAGHAWREYKAGKRELCGVPLPEGLKENDPLPEPILTPTTKARYGHDEDISKEQILEQGWVGEAEYEVLERNSLALFREGSRIAQEQGLILVDTKYEFGECSGRIELIDEVHTPDSSRYFYKEGYEERQAKGEPQEQLSKEFVRQWLIEQGFQGQEGQAVPEMPDAFVQDVSQRYIALYEQLTGENFDPADLPARIEANVREFLEREEAGGRGQERGGGQ